MNQTIINDAYKKEARERACMLITRWMYEATIPFNAITYPSFQQMIETIGQYGVSMKGPTLHELPNIKRTLERVISLNRYIYNSSRLLNMMRRFIGQRELLRPAKTRFATTFITL
ncbi:hypothetical protein AAG906_009012 [Vitis piasezkii]